MNSDIEKWFKWFHDDRAILIIFTSGIENSKIDVISQVQGEMHECWTITKKTIMEIPRAHPLDVLVEPN